MFWGEHLCADEAVVLCQCGIAATVEVKDSRGVLRGWFCREHSYRAKAVIRQEEKIAKAIVRRGLR